MPTDYKTANISEIPKSPGIYAFFLDLMSPAKIGLAGRGPWNQEKLELAKAALIGRAEIHAEIMHSISLKGELKDANKATHLGVAYTTEARKAKGFQPSKELANLSLEAVRDYAQLMHSIAIFSQPVYVGITYSQTLRDRHEQHRRAFFGGEDSLGFGARVSAWKLDWDDLIFSYHSLANPTVSLSTLVLAEKHMQSIVHPIFSLK